MLFVYVFFPCVFRDTVVYIRVWKTFPRLLYLDERCDLGQNNNEKLYIY